MGRAGVAGASRNALLADAVPPDAYGRAYGFERAMDNLGAIIGPLLALGLVGIVGSWTGSSQPAKHERGDNDDDDQPEAANEKAERQSEVLHDQHSGWAMAGVEHLLAERLISCLLLSPLLSGRHENGPFVGLPVVSTRRWPATEIEQIAAEWRDTPGG